MAKRKAFKPVEPPADYLIGDWRGHAHYACKLCPYDVLNNEQAMIEHVKLHRARPGEPARPMEVTEPERAQPNDEAAAGVFEVELEEIGSEVAENGDVHKIFTIKE